jgi:hypothetical protein
VKCTVILVQDCDEVRCWDVLHTFEDLILVTLGAVHLIGQEREVCVVWVIYSRQNDGSRLLDIPFSC